MPSDMSETHPKSHHMQSANLTDSLTDNGSTMYKKPQHTGKKGWRPEGRSPPVRTQASPGAPKSLLDIFSKADLMDSSSDMT